MYLDLLHAIKDYPISLLYLDKYAPRDVKEDSLVKYARMKILWKHTRYGFQLYE